VQRILYTGCPLPEEELNVYCDRGYEIISKGRIDEDEISGLLKNADAYIPGGEEKVTREMMQASGGRLRMISFCGAGYEYYVDMQAAKECNITVTNLPNINAQSVAEFTVGLILTLSKNISFFNAQTKNEQWVKIRSDDISERTLGIVGMGAIGSLVANMMHRAFKTKVLYNSNTGKPRIEKETGARYVDLETLFTESDIISIHIPYTEGTEHIINDDLIKRMKDDAIIINTSRAELIDPAALSDALKKRRIGGAALDCFYGGSVAKDSDRWGFLDLPDDIFIVTPHVAYNTKETIVRIAEAAIKNAMDVLEGNDCENIVS